MFLSLVYVLSYILGVKSIASEIRIYHPTLCLVIILMLTPVSGQVDRPKQSEYTEWTSWTECSKTCNNGIQIRTRDCIKKNKSCTLIEKQVKVCYTQDCRGKVIDSRDQQCRQFNNKVISGRRYYWSSYINDRRQCQLYCKATYYGFYRKFADKVEDGTECEDSTGEGICVDGQCKLPITSHDTSGIFLYIFRDSSLILFSQHIQTV